MKLIPLPAHTTAKCGFTHKAIIDYTDLTGHATAGTTTVVLQIYPDLAGATFPAGLCVLACAMNLVTPFVAVGDGDNTLFSITVGDGGDADRFLTTQNLLGATTEILFAANGAVTAPYAYPIADAIDATFIVTGTTTPLISDATAGKVEIYLMLVDLNALEKVL